MVQFNTTGRRLGGVKWGRGERASEIVERGKRERPLCMMFESGCGATGGTGGILGSAAGAVYG